MMDPYVSWWHRLCGAAGALLLVAVVGLVAGAPLPVVGMLASLALVCWAAASTALRAPAMSDEEIRALVSADLATLSPEERDRLIDSHLPLRARKLRATDPTTCEHRSAGSVPLAGDVWICDDCGAEMVSGWTGQGERALDLHPLACECWRCRETRGEEDTLRRFRARGRDPLTCAHLPGDAMPLSGDGWICGVCGDDIPEPKASAS